MPSVTLGASTYDSYQDVDGANEYLAADVLRAAPWFLRQPEAKARGLVSATRLLQRVGVTTDPAGTVPDVLAEVTAMLAADLLAKPKLFADASGSSNVKVAKAGSAQVEFFSPVSGGPLLPRDLWDMLVAAGLVGGGTASGSSALDGAYVSGISGDCDRWPYGYYPGRTDDGREGGW